MDIHTGNLAVVFQIIICIKLNTLISGSATGFNILSYLS